MWLYCNEMTFFLLEMALISMWLIRAKGCGSDIGENIWTDWNLIQKINSCWGLEHIKRVDFFLLYGLLLVTLYFYNVSYLCVKKLNCEVFLFRKKPILKCKCFYRKLYQLGSSISWCLRFQYWYQKRKSGIMKSLLSCHVL